MLLQKDLLMLRFSFIQSDYLLAGRNLTILPLEPKLGKMLILGAILNCLDPVQTVVTGLSVRDHFLMPLDKKDVS
jgi:ATP-dependent RNA helicase DHX36